LWIFSFVIKDNTNHIQIGEKLALENICVRAWWHCTHPLFYHLEKNWSCRISAYIYNTIEDMEKTFTVLEKL
jgi:selenocysteine lyase/cysteine desulfurase